MEAKLAVHWNWFGMDRWRVALSYGRAWPYQHGGGEDSKLELGRACFKAGWGRPVRGLNDRTMDVLNWIEVISRWLIAWGVAPTAEVAGRDGFELWPSLPWRQAVGQT